MTNAMEKMKGSEKRKVEEIKKGKVKPKNSSISSL